MIFSYWSIGQHCVASPHTLHLFCCIHGFHTYACCLPVLRLAYSASHYLSTVLSNPLIDTFHSVLHLMCNSIHGLFTHFDAITDPHVFTNDLLNLSNCLLTLVACSLSHPLIFHGHPSHGFYLLSIFWLHHYEPHIHVHDQTSLRERTVLLESHFGKRSFAYGNHSTPQDQLKFGMYQRPDTRSVGYPCKERYWDNKVPVLIIETQTGLHRRINKNNFPSFPSLFPWDHLQDKYL